MTQTPEAQAFNPPHDENEVAGVLRHRPVASPYERFMQEQGIPIHTDLIGARDSRNLTRARWERMGGEGAFIYMQGTTGRGMYVWEISPADASTAERHMYEEMYYVVEGRGSTEVWRDGSSEKQSFEWQTGSVFSIPLNTWHRLVNATSSPVVLIGVTSAPSSFNLFHSADFVFNNPYEAIDRFDEDEGYFKPNQELEAHEVTGRAVLRSNLLPDVVHCELPLDNQRSPGYRRIEPHMAGNVALHTFIGQHASGRYAKAHRGEGDGSSAAVLVCLTGRGYTFTWPHELGMRPWEAGKGEEVMAQEYVPGGFVCSSPIGGGWFHAHYGVGKEPLRFLSLLGGTATGMDGGARSRRRMQEDGTVVAQNADIRDGGLTIGYDIEDPYVKETFAAELAKEGVEFTMPESVYESRE